MFKYKFKSVNGKQFYNYSFLKSTLKIVLTMLDVYYFANVSKLNIIRLLYFKII